MHRIIVGICDICLSVATFEVTVDSLPFRRSFMGTLLIMTSAVLLFVLIIIIVRKKMYWVWGYFHSVGTMIMKKDKQMNRRGFL